MVGSLRMVKPFVLRIMSEFYSNLWKDIFEQESKGFHKVCACTSHSSSCFFLLKLTLYHHLFLMIWALFFYMNLVVSKLVGTDINCSINIEYLVTSLLSLKYKALHKLVVTNWWPTKHTTSIPTNFVRMFFVIGTGLRFDFGKHI